MRLQSNEWVDAIVGRRIGGDFLVKVQRGGGCLGASVRILMFLQDSYGCVIARRLNGQGQQIAAARDLQGGAVQRWSSMADMSKNTIAAECSQVRKHSRLDRVKGGVKDRQGRDVYVDGVENMADRARTPTATRLY